MLYNDYSNYCNDIQKELPNVKNIGWLSSNDFPSEFVDSREFLEKLGNIIALKPVNVKRGNDTCPICNDFEDIFLYINEKRVLLGHYEIWIPSFNANLIFASPTLIYHYIEKHKYLPPQDYLDSVIAFDIKSEWDGNKIRNHLIASNGKDSIDHPLSSSFERSGNEDAEIK